MHLNLITLTGTSYDEDIYELSVPTTAGTIVINDGHAPLLGAVAPGQLTFKRSKSEADSKHQTLKVNNGTIEVLKNTVTVLVDEVELTK